MLNKTRQSEEASSLFPLMFNLLAPGVLSACLGEQGALLLGSKMQRWSSIRPRWPCMTIFMNLCCSSGDSAFFFSENIVIKIQSIDEDQKKVGLKRIWNYLKASESERRTEQTFKELERLRWEGTCNRFSGTNRCWTGAEAWWWILTCSWENKALFQNTHQLLI